jgi:hypothetical protein
MPYTTNSNSHNLVVAFVSGVPGLLFAAAEQNIESLMRAIILPCFLFLIGKGIDIFLRFYFERKNAEKRRLNDKE